MADEEQKDGAGAEASMPEENSGGVIAAAPVRSFREQLRAALSIARENFKAFLLVGLLGIGGAGVIAMLWTKIAVGFLSAPSMLALALLPIAGACLTAVPVLLMSAAFFMLVTGRVSSAAAAYKAALPRFFGMALLSLFTVLAVSGGFLLLIVPGVLLSVWFYFAGFVYFSEGLSPLDSLIQSKEYARGHFKQISLRLLLISLAALLVAVPAAAFLLVPVIGAFLSALFSYFTGMVFFAFGYVLYSDLASDPKAVKVRDMPRPLKIKSLGLALAGALVALGAGGAALTAQMSALMNSPMNDMMMLAAAGDMSSPEAQERMQEMLQRMSAQEGGAPGKTAAGAPKKTPAPAETKAAEPAAAPEKEPPVLSEAEQEFNDTVSELLASHDWRIRKETVAGLGWLGLREFMPQIKRLTRDPDPEVRKEAGLAMALLRAHSD